MIKPHSEFEYLDEYAKVFPINEKTVFAWDGVIYSNFPLPEHIKIHERVHLQQQEKYGLMEWKDKYLHSPVFRLGMEIEAYKEEINRINTKRIKDKMTFDCAKKLSSALYGNIISFQVALEILKK